MRSQAIGAAWRMPDSAWTALRVGVAACAFGLMGGVVCLAAPHLPPEWPMAAASVIAACACGHAMARRQEMSPGDMHEVSLRVADELAQYRAFTRLLRDQGQRIAAMSGEAAATITTGLTGMDRELERLASESERGGAALARALRALSEPVIGMLSALQFQDVTQQQLAFLSRLSVLLDEHMAQLSAQLGEGRHAIRAGRFKEIFDAALAECVMDGQRDDHHAASGRAAREESAPRLELF